MAILLNLIISYKIIINLTTKVIPIQTFNNKDSYNLIKFVILQNTDNKNDVLPIKYLPQPLQILTPIEKMKLHLKGALGVLIFFGFAVKNTHELKIF